MAVTIKGVQAQSPAEKAGLKSGMRLLAVNGRPIADGLDYEFYTAAPTLRIKLENDGKPLEVRLEKPEYQPLGLEFESYLITPQRRCKNQCVFCFIDQLPKGLRPSLYFKDDDERLGFLFGNYITLTNLGEAEVERIITMRFSPVNISVHTANPALRARLMGNPQAGRALSVIPRLAAGGIALNFQLVLAPGLNDGEELRSSIEWLAGFYPATQSIAAVPVGLTRHRHGLPPLCAYTRQSAAAQLGILLEAGEKLLAKTGVRLVYPSDEWFLLAGRDIPPGAFYGDYPQLENGVGMWRLLHGAFTAALKARRKAPAAAEVDIATGVLAAPLLRELAGLLAKKYPRVRVTVHAVENRFFGPGVTVAGLLTGADIMEQLRGKLQGSRLLLCADMLRAEADRLLDDTTPKDIAAALGVPVQITPRGGEALLKAILSPDGR